MAAKRFRERYYDLDEEEIQVLLTEAKAGDAKSQEQLLEIFDNFLSKYVTLLYYGKYNLGDADIRRFIGLFVGDGSVRKFLLRNKLNPGGFQHVSETMNRITGMAERYGTEEDTRQTIQMTFLQCVMRYTRRGEIPFKGYLYNYFYFLLKKNVDIFLQDQLGRKSFPLIDESDDSEDGEEVAQGFSAPPEPSAEELMGPEEIDEHWVAGDSAFYPFDELSIQERQLLKWRHVDGLRSSQIAKKITEHPNTVREHFNRIKGKLHDLLVTEDFDQLF